MMKRAYHQNIFFRIPFMAFDFLLFGLLNFKEYLFDYFSHDFFHDLLVLIDFSAVVKVLHAGFDLLLQTITETASRLNLLKLVR